MNPAPRDTRKLPSARGLPISVRPWGRESLPCYVDRLARVNRTRHTALWRLIGLSYLRAAGDLMLSWEASLNELAAERLVIMSGLPAERLLKALPALSWPGDARHLPAEVPAVHIRQVTGPSAVVCPQCTARRGITDKIRAHLALPDIVCPRHHIWQSPTPCDVSAVPDIERAQRTLRTVRNLYGNRAVTLAIRDARWILGSWTYVPSMEPELEYRWDSRRHQLRLPTWRRKDELPVQIMTHPELVALTAALAPNYTDPNYFHRADFQFKRFNEHLRTSLGLPAVRTASGERTGGMIGSLSHLVRAAAISAILDGSESITRRQLHAIHVDPAGESAYRASA